MSADCQRTKELHASDSASQSSDNAVSIASHQLQHSSLPSAYQGTFRENAASTAAVTVDILDRPNLSSLRTMSLSSQQVHTTEDPDYSIINLSRNFKNVAGSQCDSVLDFPDDSESWTGSTCVKTANLWSEKTLLSASERRCGPADKILEDKEKSDPQDHLSNKGNTSESSLKLSRMNLSTYQTVFAPKYHNAVWPTQDDPWSAYNLTTDDHVRQIVFKNYLRNIPVSKRGINPQKDKRGSTWNPIILPILRPELHKQNSTNMSDRLLRMVAVLDPGTNPGRANSLFNGLDILVGDLRHRFPNDRIVLGLVRALERLELFYLLNFNNALGDSNQWSLASMEAGDYAPSGTGNDERHQFTGCSPLDLNSAAALDDGKRSGCRNLTSGDRNSGDRPSISGKRRTRPQKKGRRLACPLRRHQELHYQPLQCGFEGAANMSEVTQHLRRRVHRNSLPFIILCRHCWVYVTDQDEYRNVHKDDICGVSSQPRGSRVSEHWQKLYRSIYPGSETIPSPWIDECQQQDVILSGNCDTTRPSEPSASDVHPFSDLSFLDEEPRGNTGLETFTVPQNPPQQITPATEQQAELAALNLFNSMFQESFRRPGDLGDYYLNHLIMEQTSQFAPEQIQQFADRFRNRASEIVNLLQLQAENTSSANNPPALPTSNDALDLPTLPDSQTWLGQFPVPEQMRVDLPVIALPALQVFSNNIFRAGDWAVTDSSSLRSSSVVS